MGLVGIADLGLGGEFFGGLVSSGRCDTAAMYFHVMENCSASSLEVDEEDSDDGEDAPAIAIPELVQPDGDSDISAIGVDMSEEVSHEGEDAVRKVPCGEARCGVKRGAWWCDARR